MSDLICKILGDRKNLLDKVLVTAATAASLQWLGRKLMHFFGDKYE